MTDDKKPNLQGSITYNNVTADLRKLTDKEIADAVRKSNEIAFGPSDTITAMVTDTELENKALKAIVTMGLLYHALTHSASCGKDELTYDWDTIIFYCREITKETRALKDAATELQENKA